MGAAEKIPWTELAMSAEDCAELWGMSADHWLRTVACKPGPGLRGSAPRGAG